MAEIATVAKLPVLDSLKLISLIVTAARNARMHGENCRKFAEHLKLMGGLLEQLKVSELREHPETSEPLKRLEEALRKAFVLVDSCKNKSCLYLLVMGSNITSQFRVRQAEIDRLLHLIPLIALVKNNLAEQHLKDIERDSKNYTLDEEEKTLGPKILNNGLTPPESSALRMSLTHTYQDLSVEEALKKENQKLRKELKHLQSPEQYHVIKRLIDITETTQLHHWRHGLCACCTDPLLCIGTFICPCCTFSTIAATADGTAKCAACTKCLICTLLLSCCFYTCCYRRKLRKRYKIEGGSCDDCWAHSLCFFCALVQEAREIKSRERERPGSQKKSVAPSGQTMERD